MLSVARKTIAQPRLLQRYQRPLIRSAIEIRMLGPVVLLEDYITKPADREKAIALAAIIVGSENVQDRMLSRFPVQ